MNYEEEKTVYMQSRKLQPRIFIIYANKVKSFHLTGNAYFGRSTEIYRPEISVDSHMRFVSRRHGFFTLRDGKTFYQDFNGVNGTWHNNQKLASGETILLENGDVLRIVSTNDPLRFLTLIYSTDYPTDFIWKMYPLQEIHQLAIGRQSGSGLQLQSLEISRHHAILYKSYGRWTLSDSESTNGVFLNGLPLYGPTFLMPGDTFRIANMHFIYGANYLIYQQPAHQKATFTASTHVDPAHIARSADQQNKLQIHIKERSVIIKLHRKYLLQNINVTIQPGEMVLILGGSGAGKTTFMNAVMGYERAKGRIMYGSTDVYAEYASMKYQMGFVPQQDLLRLDDRVIDTLHDAARMKVNNLNEEEKEARIQTVLHTLGLEPEREKLVKKLSGGQRKRLSIAVEYISNPNLFFLDEPDSGLDGIMARTLMTNLRKIANESKIVMVISHGPDRAADLFDKVIVLAKSVRDDCGHLAFFGSVDEAYRFFDTDTLEGAVKRINRTDEGGDGLSDHYIDKYTSYESNNRG